MNKQEAIKQIRAGKKLNKWSFELFRDDKEVVIEAVRKSGINLGHASDRLKNDREVVMEAVKQSGVILQYASDKLRDDKEVVFESVIRSATLGYASDRLKDDKNVVLEAVKRNGASLQYASDKLRNDKEIVLESIKQEKELIIFASSEIKEMCDGRDPFKTLETAIAYDKLKSQITSKPKKEIKKVMKI